MPLLVFSPVVYAVSVLVGDNTNKCENWITGIGNYILLLMPLLVFSPTVYVLVLLVGDNTNKGERTENGIKVVLYATLIVAILLLVYKKTNMIKGFKEAKQKFAQELEFEIMKHIIELSGGNPSKLPEILGFPPNLKFSEQ